MSRRDMLPFNRFCRKIGLVHKGLERFLIISRIYMGARGCVNTRYWYKLEEEVWEKWEFTIN